MTDSSPPSGPVVAIDLGGTDVKAALVAPDGSVLRWMRRPTHRARGPEAVLATVVDTATTLAAVSRDVCERQPLAVGVVVPGIVDERRGLAVYAANLGWRDLALRDVLSQRLGLPVALGHDVRAGALAEGRAGAARGMDDFLFVAIGTGIAAAQVRDGAVQGGRHGGAGELGHVTVRRSGPKCGCGARGCVESLASASAVARRYTRALRRLEGPGAPRPTAEQVSRLAATGDPVARRVWDDAVAALADGLATCTVLNDPGLIVLGGGLARAGDTLLGPLRTALAERLRFHRAPELVVAELGTAAGCHGAALLALDLVGVTARPTGALT